MSIANIRPAEYKSQTFNGIIRVLSDDGRRIIGIVKGFSFTKTNWHSTKHICRKYQAIGLDHTAFLNQIMSSANLIIVPDKDTGREYRVTVEDFKRFAIMDNLGWGLQLFLPLRYWRVIEPDGEESFQLSLWGGTNGE